MKTRFYILISLLSFSLLLQGCGLLLGNIKPIEQKADSYGIMDLHRENADWVVLRSQAPESGESPDKELPDVAYQSSKTAAIISLNSACRPSVESPDKSLRDFTNLLLLGISEIQHRQEKELTLQGVPALETIIQGQLNSEPVALQTVVLRKRSCLFDLSLVTRPERLAESAADFSRFVNSLRLK